MCVCVCKVVQLVCKVVQLVCKVVQLVCKVVQLVYGFGCTSFLEKSNGIAYILTYVCDYGIASTGILL